MRKNKERISFGYDTPKPLPTCATAWTCGKGIVNERKKWYSFRAGDFCARADCPGEDISGKQ